MNKKYIFMIAAVFYMLNAHACEKDNPGVQLPTEIQQAITTAHQTGEYADVSQRLYDLIRESKGTPAETVLDKAFHDMVDSPLYQILDRKVYLFTKCLASVTPEILAHAQRLLIKKGISQDEAQKRIQIIDKRKVIDVLFLEFSAISSNGIQIDSDRLKYLRGLRAEVSQLEETLLRVTTFYKLP